MSGVTLDLAADRTHGLIGRNGAGKTTLLSGLASLRPADTGSIRIAREEPFENESVMEDVCLIRESGDVMADKRITTDLAFLEGDRPLFDRAYGESLLRAFRLDPHKRPQSLFRGQSSAFGAIVGLATRAPLTMFDEVHLGMNAPWRQRFYDELLKDFAEHPRTIIVSSHLSSSAEYLTRWACPAAASTTRDSRCSTAMC